MLRFLVVLSLAIFLGACTSNKPVANFGTIDDGYSSTKKKDKTTNINEIEDLDVAIPLHIQLNQVPGVSVRGQGPSASVRIRGGTNSFFADTEPLFVLDGQPLGGGYSELYASVNIVDIDKISVLKDAAASMYGTRGANGVIVVRTKR
ncbi:MAG: TonB-dependent receptor plug domain-containing protein [Bacteroidota bacterium]